MNGQTAKPRRGIDTGRHYEFLGGRLVVGPDWKSLGASLLLVMAPSGVFMGFVAPWLGRHLSWGLFVVSIIIILFALSMLFVTAFTNPGFLPRHEDDDEEYGRRNPTKDFQVNGFTVTTKWCTTCNHYRPPRCSHCAICDNCIDRFDHHCPWTGTCIGRRNYRWFLTFVFSAAGLCIWCFALSLTQLLKYADTSNKNFGEAISKYPASLVIMIYTFFAFMFVGGLSSFHTYLSATNQTTYEHFRHRYSDAGNPYNIGILRNCAAVFCTGVPKRSELAHLASRAPGPEPSGPSEQEMVQQAPLPQPDQERKHKKKQHRPDCRHYKPPVTNVAAGSSPEVVHAPGLRNGDLNGAAHPDPAHLEAPDQLPATGEKPAQADEGAAAAALALLHPLAADPSGTTAVQDSQQAEAELPVSRGVQGSVITAPPAAQAPYEPPAEELEQPQQLQPPQLQPPQALAAKAGDDTTQVEGDVTSPSG